MSTTKKRAKPIGCQRGSSISTFAERLLAFCEWCDWDVDEAWEHRWNAFDKQPSGEMTVFLLPHTATGGVLTLRLEDLCSHRTVESMQAYLETEIAIARVKE